ncbi:DUF3631 domain-containing protein [Actinopolyspora mortivallis]|uniref:DUF3631 domain-containing protein n=1 Tax=Actinopolyspora mortivallis TaxID=33906 RepID=A0A2T0GVA4_ACTMO|nr:DUF3631 domain-containing protein [Actinopolyspora mortivallis]PRW63027.1 hypothetical protein CEP50_12645 [Actinopolyspora mortivallis]
MTNDTEPATTSPGEVLLDELHAALTRYVVLPSPEATDAVVLWIAATHAQPAWAHAPRLVIRGPAKRCGKSRLVDIIEATCHDPFLTVNSSPSAVYRSISDDPPTMLVDEADTIFGAKADGNEDLRGLLNAGHQRNRPAKRYDAASNQVESIPTFAMAALAGIGAMPDTIEDRAVVIHMRRRAPGETVAPYRHRRDRPHLSQLADRLTQWLRGDIHQLEHAEPELPVEDRAADTWEPLIIVADHAGGSWPDRARHAARLLLAEADHQDQESLTIRLLTDCRTAFGDHAAITTRYLLDRLNNDAEAPWHEQGQHGLTAARLARLLAEFGIRSGNTRFPDGSQAKGYRRADFLDAWNRYCPPEATEPSQPSQASHPSAQRDGTPPWDGPSRPSRTETPPDQPPHWDGTTRPSTPSRPSLTSIGTPGTAGTTHRHAPQEGAA